MSRWRMIAYACLGSLVSVVIWSFVGGCQSAPTNGPEMAPPEEVIVSEESEEELIEEGIIPAEPEAVAVAVEEEVVEVEEVSVPPSPKVEDDYYTVKKGDTLWAISRSQGVTVQQLRQANEISDPSKISVGQKLLIPR